jgi:acyl-CoA synthetase (AMP-forming)/AMP-acid ligase II
MFHCNGWCFPWTVAMLGGTHVCLRRVEAGAILQAMCEHGVDHYCAAPIVHNLILSAEAQLREGITQKVRGMVAGAAPPAAMIEGMAQTAGILCVTARGIDRKPKLVYFMTIDKAKFRKPVVPGDQIRFELEMISLRKRFCKMRGLAYVDGQVVAEAELFSSIIDR